jgi:peptidoglycan hydrolase CwlO-like protein
MDFLAIYSEAGMIGVVGALLVYVVYSMNKRGTTQAEALQDLKIENKGQSETIENVEGVLLKLLTRMDKTDDRISRKFDDLNKEINSVDNQISRIEGIISRLNGKH